MPAQSNGKLALIGLAVIVAGFGLTSAIDFILPDQDSAGKGMAAGLLFLTALIAGIVMLVVAAVRALRRS